MKIRDIIFVFIILGLLIAFIPPIRAVALLLGWAGLQMLEGRPDRNMDYSIEIEMPNKEMLKFSGETGCEHFVGPEKSGYRTLNRASVTEDGKWLLSGIDCNRGVKRKGRKSHYRVFSLDRSNFSSVYFVSELSPTKLISENFSSNIYGRINGEENFWPGHVHGPYFYRKIYLSDKLDEVADIASNKVLYERETCGKVNEESKRLQVRESFLVSSALYDKYSTGTLSSVGVEEGWHIFGEINVEEGLAVTSEKVKPGRYSSASGAPAGCLLFNYEGDKFYMSENGNTPLYLPDENAIIQIEHVYSHDFDKAIELSRTWGECDGEVAIPLPEENMIYIDRSAYSINHRGVDIERNHRRLIKNESGEYQCSKFSRLNWI